MTEETEPGWTTYLDTARLPYPFCPGCSHGLVLDKLDAALVRLQLDPRKVVIVTDIGCSGLSDQYFVTNAFHGLHGRAITYASGIKLANPDLKVIVIMGDGGVGIGGHHLVHAARRNLGMTVLVLDNFNFGMTGGQHSVTTPYQAITPTTPAGTLSYPLDVCAMAMASGASFVARTTAFDGLLTDLIVQALSLECFALLDIWELCTAYFVPSNRLSRKGLEAMLSERGLTRRLVHYEERVEYSRAYRETNAGLLGQPVLPQRPLPARYDNRVSSKLHIIIAGAAGQKIRSTAANLGRGAVLSGLWATQRDDFLVTVMTGHSVSEVIISPDEIHYVGIPTPDLLVILAPEGLSAVRRVLPNLGPETRAYVRADLLPLQTGARIVPLDFDRAGVRARKDEQAVMALAAVLRDTGFYPVDALREAIAMGQKEEVAQKNLAAVEAAAALLG